MPFTRTIMLTMAGVSLLIPSLRADTDTNRETEPLTCMDVIMTRRSIRRFRPDPVDRETLRHIVKAGSYAPSGGNRQPWEFIVVNTPELVDQVYPRVRWLGGDPPVGQRPTAYIALLLQDGTRHASSGGAAFQNMMLAAWERGVGSCCIGSIDRDQVNALLEVPPELHLFVILALGYPAEDPVVQETAESLRPTRDEHGVLHVPKRPLEDLIHFDRFTPPQE